MRKFLSDNGNGNGDLETGPLSIAELKRLRRMLQDDYYARRLKTTVKVWVITLGTIMSLVVALFTVWKELISRVWK